MNIETKGGISMKESMPEIVLLKDQDWSVIDSDYCRVSKFSPMGSSVDENGNVHSIDNTTPYASITLENEKLGKNITGYITHKEDFLHLWEAFKERKIADDEEVIIIWTREHYKQKNLSKLINSAFLPKIWVMVCRRNSYDLWFNSDFKPELKGESRWEITKPIIEWKPKIME